MNDINAASNCFHFILYADDSTLQSIVETFCQKNTCLNINAELDKIFKWLKANKLTLNVDKSKYMVFSTEKKKTINTTQMLDIKINNIAIEEIKTFNFLGLTLDKHLTWMPHVTEIWSKINRTTGILNKLKNIFPMNILRILYNSLILPYLNYALLIWGHNQGKLIKQQKKIVRIISKNKYNAHTEPIFKKLKLLKLPDLYRHQALVFYYKYKHETLPQYMSKLNFITNSNIHTYETRQREMLRPSYTHIKKTENRLEICIPNLINETDKLITDKIDSHSLDGFRKYVKHWYIDKYEMKCRIQDCYICSNN